jgi:hypothetical protein
MRRFGVLAVAFTLIFAACGDDSEPQAEGPQTQEIAVEATDYKFDAPASIGSGNVVVTLSNAGEEPHQAQLFRLNEGVEVSQLVDSAKEDATGLGLLEMGTYEGGPNAVDAGESQIATAGLQPGNYAFFCLVPDAQGRAHLGLGMAKALEVEEAGEGEDDLDADLTASADEFSFELPEQWQGTISLDNQGAQAHELQVIGVAEGKTPEDVETWFKAAEGEAGPPTWVTDGGGAVVSSGETETFEIDLEPGTYFAMCFVADPERKAPHFALGMMTRFQVE